MKSTPTVTALIAFIGLSYLVKCTNGDLFGAGRLVGETAVRVLWNTGAAGVETVRVAATQTPEYSHQQNLADARKGGGDAASQAINVTVVLDGKQIAQSQAEATATSQVTTTPTSSVAQAQ
jgi:hypothetical protein